MDKVGSLFWNSSVFLPKGVSTEILNAVSAERTRELSAGMWVCLWLAV